MTVNEILEYMLDWVSDDFDTDAGSFFYDLLYPVAVEVYTLQNKLNVISTNAFALTASGEYLDRKAAEQGLTRRAATFAKGAVRIEGGRGEIVSQGAKVAADNVLFSVDETKTIPEAGYVDVTATCTTAGTAGNVSYAKIGGMILALDEVEDYSNLRVNGGTANITLGDGVIPVLGTVVLS